MRRLLVIGVLAAALLAGCGDEGDRDTAARPATAPAAAPAPAPRNLACRTLREADAARFLRAVGSPVPARFEVEHKPDSEHLSDCRYFDGDRAGMWLTIDRAVQAQKRYFYRLTEANEFAGDGRGPGMRLVRHVGQDKTYGGAGAFWTPTLNRLMAYRDDTILVVGFRVEGLSDARSRRAAADVARHAYRRLFGNRPPAPVTSLAGRKPTP
jgi:hypothetical protein